MEMKNECKKACAIYAADEVILSDLKFSIMFPYFFPSVK